MGDNPSEVQVAARGAARPPTRATGRRDKSLWSGPQPAPHGSDVCAPAVAELRDLPLDLITRRADVRARAGDDAKAVQEYAELMRDGVQFAPVAVFFDGAAYWLAHGFHRVAAAEAAGLGVITAEVRLGGKREAVFFAAGANREHGVRWTNADKRRAVLALLVDPEWVQWSDVVIARHVGVTDKTVARYRREFRGRSAGGNLGISEVTRKYRTGHGSVAKMRLRTRGRGQVRDRGRVQGDIPERQVDDGMKDPLAIGDREVSHVVVHKREPMPKSIRLSKEMDRGRVRPAAPVDLLALLAKRIEVVLALGQEGLHCQDDAELASLADATAALLEMLRRGLASRH